MRGRLLQALGGVLTALLLLEFLVRALDVPPRPLSPLPIPSYRLSDDPKIGFEYRPGYRPTDEPFDQDHRNYSINAAGFRDRDYPLDKAPGVYRIAVLGDSTTAGNGIPEVERIYPKRLEALLNERAPAGLRFEVLNMGVAAYHPVQEVGLFEARGLAYDPDLVLVTFCQNDFKVNAALNVLERLRQMNGFSRPVVPGSVLDRITRASRLAFGVYHRLGVSGSLRRWYEDSFLRGRSPVEVGYTRLAELQRERGFRALVVILPDFSAPFDEYAGLELHERVRAVVAALPELEFEDLLGPFAERENDAPSLSLDSQHMNERGHEIMAAVLLPLVLERALAGDPFDG